MQYKDLTLKTFFLTSKSLWKMEDINLKILLTAINAKYIHSNLAVYSLRAYAMAHGFNREELCIAEYTINQYSFDILTDIYKKNPDVICFSCYIWNIALVEELVRELKKVLPSIPIWLGGPEVSYHAKEWLERLPMIKGIMLGEGEETFFQLAQYYKEGQQRELSAITGFIYREGTSFVETGVRKGLNLDEIPFPYENLDEFENKIIYYESSRGCPFSCSYCLSSIDKQVRFRSLERTCSELLLFLEKKVSQVKFIDRTFNCNRTHAMQIWKFIQEHDNGITNFHFEIAADLLQEEEITLFHSMRAGLIQLEIGVQSTNETTLSLIRRKTDLKKLAYWVRKVKEGQNIHQHLDLIAGLPLEDFSSFSHSFNEVYAMKPNQLQLGFLKVLKGASIEKEAEKYGIVAKDSPPYEVLYTNSLSFEEILHLKKVEEQLEIYYNSNQFSYSILFLESFYPTPFALYEELANYYESRLFHQQKHSRISRYYLLLDFLKGCVIPKQSKQQQLIDAFCELLTFDVYLRENIKTRPDFCRDINEDKETIWNFYNSKENIEQFLPDYMNQNVKQIKRLTHMEHFTIHIEETAKSGSVQQENCFYLFDYQNRNFCQEAKVIKWQPI